MDTTAAGHSSGDAVTNFVDMVSDILEASFRNESDVDTPLSKINRSQYQAFSNKSSTGQPSQYFVQRFIDKVTITLYLTPGDTQAGKFIYFYYVKRIQDAGKYTNEADVVNRFVPCMCAGLSYYISMKKAPQRTQEMKLFMKMNYKEHYKKMDHQRVFTFHLKLIIRRYNGKVAKGKYALAISDRSGQAFPWREMVTEWNGAFVHISEYEPKQPQLEPKPFVADPQGLEQARPQRFPSDQIGGGKHGG